MSADQVVVAIAGLTALALLWLCAMESEHERRKSEEDARWHAGGRRR